MQQSTERKRQASLNRIYIIEVMGVNLERASDVIFSGHEPAKQ